MTSDEWQVTRPDSASATSARGWRRLFLFTLYSSLFTALAATAAHDTPLNPDDPAYLRRQYVWFQAQEPARQQQLRRLHAQFTDLAADEQARLTKVMQNYNAWLARLPEEDRKQVLAAPTTAARVEAVKQFRERDWVESLPRSYREEYARLEGDARKQRVQEWRAEETERREEWILAQQQFPQGRVPPMFLPEGRTQFEAFVLHLRENLSDTERKELEEARAAADDFGNYFWYAREVVRLADAHPPLPGHVGPKEFGSLPAEVKDFLRKNDPHFRRKGDEPKELRKASGRWPEFALELTRYCQKNNLKLPVPLGDCRKDQMPTEVVLFLDKVLEPQLKKTDAGKVDLEALNKAQGYWPEYPRMILDLAKRYKLHIPGWTLPGPQQQWDKLRAGKPRLK
ncbi:MAG TPA: hypothetical protein VKD72_33920 [Gemmataceae bacterium]|nr:hypothetical protein [Gemmataceae bacterium]